MLAILTITFVVIGVAVIAWTAYQALSGAGYSNHSPYNGGTLLTTWYVRLVFWIAFVYGPFYAFENQLFSLSCLLLAMAVEASLLVGYRGVLFNTVNASTKPRHATRIVK